CDGANVTGDAFLSGGFSAEGEVRLLGAQIGGNLICGQGTFKNPGSTVLNCSRTKVVGAVLLNNDFAAAGEVVLGAAQIGGALDCIQGTFKNPGGTALSCIAAKVSGILFLRGGFCAEGEINFASAYARDVDDDDVARGNAGKACVVVLDGFTYE